jgi:flagellar hook-basal body complex protein FliE
MENIHAIGPVRGDQISSKGVKPQETDSNHPGFKQTLEGYLKDVNDIQNKADASIEKMVAGEITDVHQVMNTVQEANLAFNMMMEIRGKVMDAYQEIMRMRL